MPKSQTSAPKGVRDSPAEGSKILQILTWRHLGIHGATCWCFGVFQDPKINLQTGPRDNHNRPTIQKTKSPRRHTHTDRPEEKQRINFPRVYRSSKSCLKILTVLKNLNNVVKILKIPKIVKILKIFEICTLFNSLKIIQIVTILIEDLEHILKIFNIILNIMKISDSRC